MPALSFLDIPRELRDFIYGDYLTIDGGYHFNFKTGKLEPAKPGQQPLNLALTCSLIAAEIRGLALNHNVISFSTVGGCRVSAFRFERMTQYINRHRAQMRRLNLDMDPAIVELVDYQKPWAIASLVELDRMADVLSSTLKEECCVTWPKVWTAYEVRPYDGWDFYHLERDDRSKYKYSAAAAAIFFFEANPGLHCHIRRIVLDEDCESVNHPSRHAKGLICFTEANPRLRIEQRLGLWTNGFLDTDKTYSPYDRFDIASSDERHTWGLGWPTSGLSPSVYDWIRYALKLPSNFSMVFDGSPSPDLAAEIFRDFLVGDVVLQVARERCWQQGLMPEPNSYYRNRAPFIGEGYPEAITAIASGTSSISCNFEVSRFGDLEVEEVIRKYRDSSYEEWSKLWWRHSKSKYVPTSPLPSWVDLLRQGTIIDGEE
ncbi:hypothetical protein SCARD494_06793 [Seiridium cardinale]